MNRSFPKKGFVIACIACLAALALTCGCARALDSPEPTFSASTEEVADRIKVFIGDTNDAAEGYTQQRAAYIKDAARADAGAVMEAVIGFDDYYTAEDITAWAEDYDITINRAYMWPKGTTGRLALHVENNDIETSLEGYKQQVKENEICENDPQFAADYQRLLDGEFGIFALAVTATAEELDALNTEADRINYVDVMYNAEVEAYAEKINKPVSYIELPSKPDGAL